MKKTAVVKRLPITKMECRLVKFNLLSELNELMGDDLGDRGDVDKFRISEECCGIIAQQGMAFEVIFYKNKEKNKSRDCYEK